MRIPVPAERPEGGPAGPSRRSDHTDSQIYGGVYELHIVGGAKESLPAGFISKNAVEEAVLACP